MEFFKSGARKNKRFRHIYVFQTLGILSGTLGSSLCPNLNLLIPTSHASISQAALMHYFKETKLYSQAASMHYFKEIKLYSQAAFMHYFIETNLFSSS